ncbi:hypothetical protein M0R72_17090 [Candidatus Pacearchaeota archaeon]|nr:hypothetical protein [Candidatus Pacearchaeota archaeon]
MSAFSDFLTLAGDRPVFCCTWFADNGNRVGMNGKVVAFDENHVVIRGKTSIHLFRAEDIIEIELESGTEIVVP